MAQTKLGRPIGVSYPARPHKCLELRPTANSIQFCGEFISLTCLAMMTGLSISGLSYVFSGKYDPSLKAVKKISGALGMTLEGFVRALEDYTATQTRYKARLGISNTLVSQ